MISTMTDLYKTIKNRRLTEKVLETRFYAISSATTGITSGVVVGIAVIIIQMGFPELEQGPLLSVLFSSFCAALLAFDVWLTYPMILDKSTEIMQKVITTFITLVLTIAGFFLGVYGFILILLITVVYWIVKIAFPLMFKR